MADITKCPGGECPLKELCYRYTAPESNYQSWFQTIPWNLKEECEYFWERKIKEDE